MNDRPFLVAKNRITGLRHKWRLKRISTPNDPPRNGQWVRNPDFDVCPEVFSIHTHRSDFQYDIMEDLGPYFPPEPPDVLPRGTAVVYDPEIPKKIENLEKRFDDLELFLSGEITNRRALEDRFNRHTHGGPE